GRAALVVPLRRFLYEVHLLGRLQGALEGGVVWITTDGCRNRSLFHLRLATLDNRANLVGERVDFGRLLLNRPLVFHIHPHQSASGVLFGLDGYTLRTVCAPVPVLLCWTPLEGPPQPITAVLRSLLFSE